MSVGLLAMGGLLMSQASAHADGISILDCSGGAHAGPPSAVLTTGPNIGTGNGTQTITAPTTVTNAQCALTGLPIVAG